MSQEQQPPSVHANRVIFFWTCLLVYSGVVLAALVIARRQIGFDDLRWGWPIVLIVLLASALSAVMLGYYCPVAYKDQSNKTTTE